MKENILVTGAGGFVGSHLVIKLLKEKEKLNIVCLMRSMYNSVIIRRIKQTAKDSKSRLEFIVGDITDFDKMNEIVISRRIGLVYHLAAKAIVSDVQKNARAAVKCNILGTLNFLELAREHKFRMVLQTTDKVYGNKTNAKVTDEFVPVDLYGVTKTTIEHMTKFYRSTYNVDVIITRPCNIIGFDLHFSRLVPSLIHDCLRGRNPKINYPVDGKFMSRQFIFVSEVVNQLIRIGQEEFTNQEFNISSPYIYNTREIADMVVSFFMNRKVEYRNLGGNPIIEIAEQSLETSVDYFNQEDLKTEFMKGLHEIIHEYEQELF